MTKQLFAKLAVRNIKSNKQIYVPYIMSSIATVTMFYLMTSLVQNDYLRERSGTVVQLLSLGSVIIGFFSLIFILYTNSFLIKRRKKEIGLYAILGMKKKHVAFVLLIESLITSIGSIFIGIISGQIIGRFVFLGLNYVLKLPVSMEYPFSIETAGITAAGFTAIFFLAFLYNISQVTFSNPIQLVRGKQTGEKEPKSSLLLFLLSLVSLGAGYWISLSTEDVMSAIIYFFLAVLLVIIGTYLLFISGSIFILKAMKKNKKLYYRPNAFISISGMLYRMKQNAVGLANISVLATMVIVAVSTTAAIFVGSEASINIQFPYENEVAMYEADFEDMTNFQELVVNETERRELSIEDIVAYRYNSLTGVLEGDEFVFKSSLQGDIVETQAIFIPKEDIENITGVSIDLEGNEVVVLDSKNEYTQPTIKLGKQAYPVHQIKDSDMSNIITDQIERMLRTDVVGTTVVLTNGAEEMQSIVKDYAELYPDDYFDGFATVQWDTSGIAEEKMAYAEDLTDIIYDLEEYSLSYRAKEVLREEWYQMNGGLLFMGIFLGGLFTFGAALITYFKQISEGYDDREKFQIMQKVGLDEKTIQKSTRSQIVWMFFLPLILAVIHTAFAFPIISKLLLLFGLVDQGLIILSIIGVVLCFSLLYWIIYRVTSRVYFSIVK
ncbi:FtsX-like permease family protein [Desemzia sp. FAM 24101]|uniref:FtsX-like permease family protein n=1 Tax=unclassified Desemzia TaxID=2685243 RepID=UPI003883B4C3